MSTWHRRNPDYTEPRPHIPVVDMTIAALESPPAASGEVIVQSGAYKLWHQPNGLYLVTEGIQVVFRSDDLSLAEDVMRARIAGMGVEP